MANATLEQYIAGDIVCDMTSMFYNNDTDYSIDSSIPSLQVYLQDNFNAKSFVDSYYEMQDMSRRSS